MALNPKHAATAVVSLTAYIAKLEKDQEDLALSILAAKETLRAMQRQCSTTTNGSGPKPRRRKGENLQLLREQFRANPSAAMTAAQLAEKIDVPQSSVQNVLKNNDEFVSGGGGLWTWKGEPAS